MSIPTSNFARFSSDCWITLHFSKDTEKLIRLSESFESALKSKLFVELCAAMRMHATYIHGSDFFNMRKCTVIVLTHENDLKRRDPALITKLIFKEGAFLIGKNDENKDTILNNFEDNENEIETLTDDENIAIVFVPTQSLLRAENL